MKLPRFNNCQLSCMILFVAGSLLVCMASSPPVPATKVLFVTALMVALAGFLLGAPSRQGARFSLVLRFVCALFFFTPVLSGLFIRPWLADKWAEEGRKQHEQRIQDAKNGWHP